MWPFCQGEPGSINVVEALWVYSFNRREVEMLTTEIVRAKCGEHSELLTCWPTININAAEESPYHNFSSNVLEGQRHG